MGWRIVHGKRYFYDAYRLGDEVIVTYLGNGPVAQREARKLEQRKQAREARKRALARIAKLKKFGEETYGEIALLLQAALVSAGFYRHYAEWRRRRYTVPKERPFFEAPPPPSTTFEEMVQQANSGDESALASLREYLLQHPEIWEKTGDVAALARESWIGRIAGGDQLIAESIRLRLESMRQTLSSPRPSLMEELAIEAILLSWLELHQLQLASLYDHNQPLQSDFEPLHKGAWRRYGDGLNMYWLVRRNLPIMEQASEELLTAQQQGSESDQAPAVLP